MSGSPARRNPFTPAQPTKGIPVLPVGHLRRDGDGCAAEVGDRIREAEAALQGRRGRHVALPLLCPSLSLSPRCAWTSIKRSGKETREGKDRMDGCVSCLKLVVQDPLLSFFDLSTWHHSDELILIGTSFICPLVTILIN